MILIILQKEKEIGSKSHVLLLRTGCRLDYLCPFLAPRLIRSGETHILWEKRRAAVVIFVLLYMYL